ncbi:flagellar hook-length control protein FliK [Virgibacillus alimentarius]|uniref:Flagellar hook-length control protein FliK n=1 Tax=Virgibacillus alimentarius TaxID=698769 RepID=A0ABS4S572_9BACI|nr:MULTISPECIES: flagellar hook-length control protein FliK [Virgibacillus]MBP2256201.1 flagellar hook-length control protein FliK [Virgibacillus alimentarius]HLR66148.1 flagellar hook-length control protein FliK [Virgibacillus sp.]
MHIHPLTRENYSSSFTKDNINENEERGNFFHQLFNNQKNVDDEMSNEKRRKFEKDSRRTVNFHHDWFTRPKKILEEGEEPQSSIPLVVQKKGKSDWDSNLIPSFQEQMFSLDLSSISPFLRIRDKEGEELTQVSNEQDFNKTIKAELLALKQSETMNKDYYSESEITEMKMINGVLKENKNWKALHTAHNKRNQSTMVQDNTHADVAKIVYKIPSIPLNHLNDQKDIKVNSDHFFEGIKSFIGSYKDAKPQKVIQDNLGRTDVEIKKYFTEIVQKAEKLIAQVSSNQEIKKIAPKLLAFIEQWIMLEKKYDAKENQIKPQTNEDTIETKIWRSLLDVFQRKHQFALQQYGDLDSDVTESNIVNFVQKVMNNNSFGYKPAGLGSSFSSMSISKLEQYAIYVNMSQIQGSYPVDQDIMDQFQNIIRRSKFLAKSNGINQLSIALRPDTLGEIRLRLTQVGGDMTVKIIVTSQATKEILQSNIHQLKSMFSPHQITIEKLDVNFQSNQELYEKEREQEQANKEDQNHPGQSKQNKQSNEDTEVHFHELLMNEKV